MLFDMAISRTDLLAFMREERYAVQASTSPKGDPEAAIIGIVVSDRFEVFFDTLDTTRKATNLRSNSRLAFVIGPTAAGSERTVQYEGVQMNRSAPNWRGFSICISARFPMDPLGEVGQA